MTASEDASTLDARLAAVEAGQRFLSEWQQHAAVPVSRLIADQTYRDDRILRRTRAWKIWSIRLAAIVAGIAIFSSLVRLIEAGLRLFGLP